MKTNLDPFLPPALQTTTRKTFIWKGQLDIDIGFGKNIKVQLPVQRKKLVCVVVAKSVEDDIFISLIHDCYGS